jgi:type IV pilus assembly protein PilX
MNYRKKQQGVVLIIALLALVAISLAGVALMRTVDTSNVVSGNVSFNMAASQAAEIGADTAYNWLTSNEYKNSASRANCLSDSTQCPLNSSGQSFVYANASSISTVTKLPSAANGNPLPMSDATNVYLPGDPTTSGSTGSYQVRYLIERMCTNTANLQEVATFSKCRAVPYYSTGVLSPINTLASGLGSYGVLYYRVTVLVNGPRNTRGISQYFFGVQDTVYQ